MGFGVTRKLVQTLVAELHWKWAGGLERNGENEEDVGQWFTYRYMEFKHMPSKQVVILAVKCLFPFAIHLRLHIP